MKKLLQRMDWLNYKGKIMWKEVVIDIVLIVGGSILTIMTYYHLEV